MIAKKLGIMPCQILKALKATFEMPWDSSKVFWGYNT